MKRQASHLLAALLAAFGLVAALALSGPAAMAGGVTATGARVGGDGQRTRFVADLTAAVGYTVYVLPDPYRVMIDLPDVRFDLPPDSGTRTLGLVTEYRYGEVEAGKSRIVLDVAGPVLIEKSFVVEPKAGQPARIVVDLVRTSREVFVKTYRAEEQTNTDAIAAAADEAPPDSGQAAAIPRPRAKPGAGIAAAKPDTGAGIRRSRPLIVIDPGHGGIDPGAIGRKKTREKDVVLAFGLTLRDVLKREGRFDVTMTRNTDEFLSLKQRVRIARDSKANLFIALHADTVRGPEARGATIYTLSEKASDAEAEALAHKENRADIIGGIDLGSESEEVTDILIDLVQRESKSQSMFFARKAVTELKTVTDFTGKPMRSAGFVVLKAPDVPSVLVELGYLSSRHDEKQLTSPAWRDTVAAAMARAIEKYFETEVAARAN